MCPLRGCLCFDVKTGGITLDSKTLCCLPAGGALTPVVVTVGIVSLGRSLDGGLILIGVGVDGGMSASSSFLLFKHSDFTKHMGVHEV